MDQVFEQSFRRAVGNNSYNDAFIGRFYEIFLSSSDEIARLFAHTNMSVQKTMLHDSLHLMLDYYRNRKANPAMQRVARVHSRGEHDIAERLYVVWLDSLLQAVQEFDSEFDANVEKAWREVLAPGIAYMQSQYEPNVAAIS